MGHVAQPQTQLDGFKSRALRAQPTPPQRHLYATEWRSLEALQSDLPVASMLVLGSDELGHAACERLAGTVHRDELIVRLWWHVVCRCGGGGDPAWPG